MGFGKSNLDDLKSRKFYTALVAEFLGTLLLVLFACGSAEGIGRSNLHISLAFALSVASIVWGIANVSGGHINPAVTMGFLITRRISLVRALLYMVVQTIGAIVGAALLKALTPAGSTAINDSLGTVGLGNGVNAGQGFGVEFLISFLFIFVIFSAVDSHRGDIGGSIPLTVGLALGMCHLWAVSTSNKAGYHSVSLILLPTRSEEYWAWNYSCCNTPLWSRYELYCVMIA